MREPSDHRESDTRGRQVIDIEVGGGYRPAVVRARPGSAIRLIFHRIDDEHCTERIVFSTPRLERRLTAYGSTPVDLPAQQAGEIRYTCGMGRYSGVIRIEEASSSWSSALRRRLGYIERRRPATHRARLHDQAMPVVPDPSRSRSGT